MDLFGTRETTALFAPLEGARGVLLAVSGGPDSVALMLLAAAWAAQRASQTRLAVATVDHGLRIRSREEAETVGEWAKKLGFPHEILTWEGAKPKTRIQEQARAARYDLLFRHARAIDADHVLTAHHADDQAETILFRLLRGSGIGGLAGMPVAARHGDLIHLRPLLPYPKKVLVDVCAARGQTFFNDPCNEDPRFARTQMRRLLQLLVEEGLDSAGLLRLSRRAAQAEHALAASTAKTRASLNATRADGAFSAPMGHLCTLPREILQRLVGSEIEALGGKSLRLERLENLAEALHVALRSATPWRGTLAGMTLALDGRGTLTIEHEAPRRRGRGMSAVIEAACLREAAAPGSGRPGRVPLASKLATPRLSETAPLGAPLRTSDLPSGSKSAITGQR